VKFGSRPIRAPIHSPLVQFRGSEALRLKRQSFNYQQIVIGPSG